MSTAGSILLEDLRARRRIRQSVERAEREYAEAQLAKLMDDYARLNAVLGRMEERRENSLATRISNRFRRTRTEEVFL